MLSGHRTCATDPEVSLRPPSWDLASAAPLGLAPLPSRFLLGPFLSQSLPGELPGSAQQHSRGLVWELGLGQRRERLSGNNKTMGYYILARKKE